MSSTVSNLVVSLPSGEGLGEALGDVQGVEFIEWNLDGPPQQGGSDVDRIDIVVPPYWGSNRQLAQLDGLQVGLVQGQSIGFNGVEKHLPDGIAFANATTVHETSTAELALALTLAMQRGIPGFVRAGDDRWWELVSHSSLADRRVLLVGYGGVGKQVEARLSGFEVSLTRLARSARTERNLAGDDVQVLGYDGLQAALTDAEVVILTVPLTPETRGLIDATALAAMPDGALLVNVARGPVVDTDALVKELSSGRLRAALDVTDPEPLPAEHPLWACPNLLVTPHVGGDSSAMLPRMAALILRQIERMQRGEAPENLKLGG